MEVYKISDVIFNESPMLKFYYIKSIRYTLTGIYPMIINNICDDWVILPIENKEELIMRLSG